jgi:hypothetical protein
VPTFADATALVALGRINAIALLQYFDPDVVISPWIRARELRRFAEHVDRAIADGWLRVEEPSRTVVDGLQAITGLNRGELEVIDLAGRLGGQSPRRLLDEGPAYEYLRNQIAGRRLRWQLVCLADVLSQLEAERKVDSAEALMRELLDGGYYAWAAPVKADYLDRCRREGRKPLP